MGKLSKLAKMAKPKKKTRRSDVRQSLFGKDTGIGSEQPVSKLRKKKIEGRSDITLDELAKYKKEAATSPTNTPAKNKRLRAVMEAKRKRLAGEKPKTEVKIKPKKTKAQKKKTKKQQINASIMADGLEATKKKFGAKLVESFIPKKTGPKSKGYTPTAELTPSGHPLTGKLGGRGGLRFKSGGKVGKKKQGYKARKDESIAMRVKKKRTKKQLKASRNESYGKWGKGKGRGKINRSSGSSFVAKLYD